MKTCNKEPRHSSHLSDSGRNKEAEREGEDGNLFSYAACASHSRADTITGASYKRENRGKRPSRTLLNNLELADTEKERDNNIGCIPFDTCNLGRRKQFNVIILLTTSKQATFFLAHFLREALFPR